MDSPPTSNQLWRFVDVNGAPLEAPVEWVPAFIEFAVDPPAWEEVEVRIQGVHFMGEVRRIGGHGRVVVPWDRSSAGRYRLEILVGQQREQRDITIAPTKM